MDGIRIAGEADEMTEEELGQYRQGRRDARTRFVVDESVPFEVWAMTVLTVASFGPSRMWRTGYVDEARRIYRDQRGLVDDN